MGRQCGLLSDFGWLLTAWYKMCFFMALFIKEYTCGVGMLVCNLW